MATAQFEITAVERLAAQEGTVALALGGIKVGGREAGVAATVVTSFDPGASASGPGDGVRLGVSKLDGETEWIVDSVTIARNGFPLYANGVGARYCQLKAVKDAAIVAALDAAAEGVT